MMYDDEDMYNLDGTLSEDMEPPFTPTPTSTTPKSLDVPSSRPPLEKQSSLHQQQHPNQPPNQTSNQSPPTPFGTVPQSPPTVPPPKQTQPQTQPQSGSSATSFFSMAKPLTAAVSGLASTFLSSVPAAQPTQSHPSASMASSHQSAGANAIPPSHPATIANSSPQPPSTTTGLPSQQTPISGQSQAHPTDPASTDPVEDHIPQIEEEQWPEEEMIPEKEAKTPPSLSEEKLSLAEREEQFEESRIPTPQEETEMPPER